MPFPVLTSISFLSCCLLQGISLSCQGMYIWSPIFWVITSGCSLISKSIYCFLNFLNLPNCIMNLFLTLFLFPLLRFLFSVFCFQFGGCCEKTYGINFLLFIYFVGNFICVKMIMKVCLQNKDSSSKFPTITS